MRSGIWVLASRTFIRFLSAVRTVILARLLAPAHFGLFAIASVAVEIVEVFSRTGFTEALIQKEGDIASYLDTAWVVQIIRGLALSAILVATAPLAAQFFREPDVTPLLRLVAVGVALRGFTNIAVVYFRKDLDFHKQSLYQVSGTLTEISVSIPCAFVLRNAFALAIGFVAANAAQLAASYLVHQYRPRFRLDLEKARELFRFGRWVLSTTIFEFLVKSLDTIVVGRLLQSTSLGLYQMAVRLANLGATEITHAISQVTFPTYSKVKHDAAKYRRAVISTLGLVAVVAIPISGFLFVFAPEGVPLILGQKWAPIVPVFQLLVLVGGLRSVTANFGAVYLSQGRPDIQTKTSIMNASILGITLYPLVLRLGIMGAVVARLLTLVTQFYTWPQFLKISGVRFRECLRVLLVPCAATASSCLAVALAKHLIPITNLWLLLTYGSAGVTAYLLILIVMDGFVGAIHRNNIGTLIEAMRSG